MAATELVAAVGSRSTNGDFVIAVNPAQANDITHICLFPDAGRIVLQRPDGQTYTGVTSINASGASGPNTKLLSQVS